MFARIFGKKVQPVLEAKAVVKAPIQVETKQAQTKEEVCVVEIYDRSNPALRQATFKAFSRGSNCVDGVQYWKTSELPNVAFEVTNAPHFKEEKKQYGNIILLCPSKPGELEELYDSAPLSTQKTKTYVVITEDKAIRAEADAYGVDHFPPPTAETASDFLNSVYKINHPTPKYQRLLAENNSILPLVMALLNDNNDPRNVVYLAPGVVGVIVDYFRVAGDELCVLQAQYRIEREHQVLAAEGLTSPMPAGCKLYFFYDRKIASEYAKAKAQKVLSAVKRYDPIGFEAETKAQDEKTTVVAKR